MQTEAQSASIQLANYAVVGELGQGGFASAKLAVTRQTGYQKLVVLKVIHKRFRDQEGFAKSLFREAQIMARMNHPNVVQVLDVLDERGVPIVVLEYLEGQSLKTVSRQCARTQTAFPLALRLHVIHQILGGLHHAHSLRDYNGEPFNLIHRDISPHNIMLTYDGQPKLLDFGLAKVQGHDEDTKTGVIKGKLSYMAPEQARGGSIDHRTDLFAVGILLYETITEKRYWGKNADADTTILRRLLSGELPDLSSLRQNAPSGLHGICARALSLEPSQRYASASDMRRDLHVVIQRHNLQASSDDLGEFLASLFSDVREKASARVDEAVRAARLVSHPITESQRPKTQTSGPPPGRSRQRSKRPAPSSRHWWMRTALLGAAMAFAIAIWLRSGRTFADPAPIEPAPLNVSVDWQPSEGAVYWNGVEQEGPPAVLQVSEGGQSHHLKIVADGYRTIERHVVISRDTHIILELSKAEP